MEDTTAAAEVTSTQKTLLSCHDPGWNDPPKWAYSPGQASTTTPTKRLLNKRVAFPLSSGSPASVTSSTHPPVGGPPLGNLPPPLVEGSALTSAPHALVSAPTPVAQSTNDDLQVIGKEEALRQTLENLESVISRELESSSKKEEVRRKLDSMKLMWEEDKLKDSVHAKVLGISKALRNNNVDGADKIHVDLMMGEAALCSSWISGIRHIILELREKSSQTRRSSTEQDSHPYLLPLSKKSSDN